MMKIVDAHHHIWRQRDLPVLALETKHSSSRLNGPVESLVWQRIGDASIRPGRPRPRGGAGGRGSVSTKATRITTSDASRTIVLPPTMGVATAWCGAQAVPATHSAQPAIYGRVSVGYITASRA